MVEALRRLKDEPWTKDCWIWLYRGAWHEFETHEIEMAVRSAENKATSTIYIYTQEVRIVVDV